MTLPTTGKGPGFRPFARFLLRPARASQTCNETGGENEFRVDRFRERQVAEPWRADRRTLQDKGVLGRKPKQGASGDGERAAGFRPGCGVSPDRRERQQCPRFPHRLLHRPSGRSTSRCVLPRHFEGLWLRSSDQPSAAARNPLSALGINRRHPVGQDRQCGDVVRDAIARNLAKRGAAKPRTEATLRGTVKALFVDKLSDAEVEAVFEDLLKLGFISVSEGKISYHLPGLPTE